MRFLRKKGQAALEFLTTYGWAFLIILVMIGALAYFGVLDPSNFAAERCVATTPLSCDGQNYLLSTTSANISLRNGYNEHIYAMNVSYRTANMPSFLACNDATTNRNDAPRVAASRTGTINCTWSGGLTPGSRERFEIRFDACYESDTACEFARTSTVELYANVQE